MPQGWTRIEMAPKTKNSTTNYKKTTGMVVEASMEGKKPKIGVKFNNETQQETAIEDFTAINNSTKAECDWQYWHTHLYPPERKDYDKLIDHNSWTRSDIKHPPQLATSALPMNSEVVYEVEPSAMNAKKQNITLRLGHRTVKLQNIGAPPSLIPPLPGTDIIDKQYFPKLRYTEKRWEINVDVYLNKVSHKD